MSDVQAILSQCKNHLIDLDNSPLTPEPVRAVVCETMGQVVTALDSLSPQLDEVKNETLHDYVHKVLEDMQLLLKEDRPGLKRWHQRDVWYLQVILAKLIQISTLLPHVETSESDLGTPDVVVKCVRVSLLSEAH